MKRKDKYKEQFVKKAGRKNSVVKRFVKKIIKRKRWGEMGWDKLSKGASFCMATTIPSLLVCSAIQFFTWRCQVSFFCLIGQLPGFSSGGAKLKHRSWESNVDVPKSFLIVDDLARNNKGLWQHTASWQIFKLKHLNHKHPHRTYTYSCWIFSNSLVPLFCPTAGKWLMPSDPINGS